MGLGRAILRGAAYRCPSCGEGRYHPLSADAEAACPDCHRPYLSDRGDWTGAAEITLLITTASGLIAFHLAGGWGLQGRPRFAVALATALLALLLAYPRVRGAWIGLVHYWEGPEPRPWPDDYEDGWPGVHEE